MHPISALAMHFAWGTVGQAFGAWLVVAGMLWRFVQRITRAARTITDSTRANTVALMRLDARIETLEHLERGRLHEYREERESRERDRGRRPPPMEKRR